MNWEAVSGISEIVGAAVVVISLIYVAIQIRQNTQAIKYQTSQDLVKATSESAYLLSTDAELAEIFQKGCFDRQTLSEPEQLRFNSYIYGYYNQVDFIYDQYTAGQVSAKTWNKIDKELPVWLKLPGVRDWWEQDKQRFSPEFVEYLDTRLANSHAPNIIPTVVTAGANNATE